MNDKELEIMIEKAKENSKQNFLRFVKGIYNVDESVFEHLWEVPVIDKFQGDTLIRPLEDEEEYDELLDKIDEFFDEEIGNKEACFIYVDKMEGFLTEEEEDLLNDWKSRVKDPGGAVIVYDGAKLKDMYKTELLQENKKSKNPKSKEELDEIFLKYLTGTIQHERCHLNASTLEIKSDYHEDYIYHGKEDTEHTDDIEYINGGEVSSYEIDDFVKETKNIGNSFGYLDNYNNRNDVLVDTLAQMMNYYQEGDSINDCLDKILVERNGKSQYEEFDDSDVLSVYILFPEEMTEWATFGAYGEFKESKLKEKIRMIFGDDSKEITGKNFQTKILQYIKENDVTEKQLEMFQKLGVKGIKEFNPVDIGISSIKSVSSIDLLNAHFKIDSELKKSSNKEIEEYNNSEI